MLMAILIILALPIVDLGRSRGLQFRSLNKFFFFVFIANFFILMQIGAKHVEDPFILLGQVSTIFSFSWFLVVLPVVSVF